MSLCLPFNKLTLECALMVHVKVLLVIRRLHDDFFWAERKCLMTFVRVNWFALLLRLLEDCVMTSSKPRDFFKTLSWVNDLQPVVESREYDLSTFSMTKDLFNDHLLSLMIHNLWLCRENMTYWPSLRWKNYLSTLFHV